MPKTTKKRADEWCSKYIRLRDCIEYGEKNGLADVTEFGQCCTCRKIVRRKGCDQGHFISRGLGGSSGVYFDERNINLQCKQCNLCQGRALEYTDFMIKKYGQEVIDELRWLDKNQSYKGKFIGLELMYKAMYLALCAQCGIQP